MGPLCKPPAWSCMSCDGGLWTLAVVLPFSADFMPLLSFTFTQNKQHRACLLWELVSLSLNRSVQLLHFPLAVLLLSFIPLLLRYSNFFFTAFSFFFFFPFHLVFWPRRTRLFTSLFPFFLLLDDFTVNRCTCSQSTSCYYIL